LHFLLIAIFVQTYISRSFAVLIIHIIFCTPQLWQYLPVQYDSLENNCAIIYICCTYNIYTNILPTYNCYNCSTDNNDVYSMCYCIGVEGQWGGNCPSPPSDPRHAEIPFRAAAPLLWPVRAAVFRTMGLLMKIATERQMRMAGKVSVQTNYILLCRINSYTHTHTGNTYIRLCVCTLQRYRERRGENYY